MLKNFEDSTLSAAPSFVSAISRESRRNKMGKAARTGKRITFNSR
jgi:hypothetical protein